MKFLAESTDHFQAEKKTVVMQEVMVQQ